MPLVCAEPGTIEQQQLQPEDVINHEEDQHEEQSDAEAAAQLHGGQRHCNTNTPEASVTAKPRPHGQKTTLHHRSGGQPLPRLHRFIVTNL